MFELHMKIPYRLKGSKPGISLKGNGEGCGGVLNKVQFECITSQTEIMTS